MKTYEEKYKELKEDMKIILTQIMCECDLSQTDGLDKIVENYMNNLDKEEYFVSRFEILLHNALVCIEEDNMFDTHNRMLKYLGMTEEEYNKVMGE